MTEAADLDRLDLDDVPVRAVNDEETARRCYPLFEELRPQLGEDLFLTRWREQSNEGYKIVYIELEETVVAAAGFRTLTSMAWGRILYLDDLVTHAGHRGKGLGSSLLRYLQDKATELGCAGLHLDAAYTRQAAHRSYLRNGFVMNAHHMVWSSSSHHRKIPNVV